jgi:predicted TIM-barrel fold metal-dependent hydrolase
MHVIEPDKYPFPTGVKPPQEATLAQALSNAQRIGLPNLVFVQLSTYGYDNTWVFDALKTVGKARGRGVIAFDPAQTDLQTLQQWHDIGVRGVRVNLRSSKTVVDKAEIQRMLRKYAEKLRPMKTWSIGLYADMGVLEYVQPIVAELQVKLVLEHFGSPASLPLDQVKQPGWNALRDMMEDPSVYVKMSAPYLFSRSTDFQEFDSLAMALLRARNGDGVVFGSDWPHTQSRGYDVLPFMQKVADWCHHDEVLLKKVFRDNARTLWDVSC